MATRTVSNLVARATQTGAPQSSSLSAFLSTLIPSLLVAVAFVAAFFILRNKVPRVYSPRTFLDVLAPNEKTPRPESGTFSWIKPFRGLSDTYVLNHGSLDTYLFLRFLKMIVIICFVGCIITWPVLFPVNATGYGGQSQFDLLSFSNARDNNRYFAHVFIAWIFLGFVMFVILRETIHYINLRHAYMLSPFQSSRISSRTVLFSDVPESYLREGALRTLFGPTVKNYWVATECKDLTEEVENRDKAAFKLEGAEVKLSTTANKARLKAIKKAQKENKPLPAAKNTVSAEESGTFSSQWLTEKDRPTHRLKFLIGKKVDTINWAREELTKLIPKVSEMQAQHRASEAKLLPAVFVEFNTQADAQFAFRQMRYEKAHKIEARETGIIPTQIIWKNVGMKKTQRTLRMGLAKTFIALLVIFWAIPVAVVGAISNINYLTEQVPFLKFILSIPPVILGVVTGLLPVVLLAVLMALVPIICRLVAKAGGEVTLAGVELRTQNWYFSFQVIQVFLVTTLSSAASSVAAQIVTNPTIATSLLATNLPKASNFYISFFVLQGLAIASGALLNIAGFAMYYVVARFLDKTPRKIYKRYISLSGAGWGSTYPKFTNLAVIAITYSAIAPLLLGFACVGFVLIYIGFRYNFFYVITNDIDTRGFSYARALQHLTVGVYLAELCLIGLFAIGNGGPAIGPLVLMIIFFVFTIIAHVLMRHALKPLTTFLPATLSSDDQLALFGPPAETHHFRNPKHAASTETTPAGSDAVTAEHSNQSSTAMAKTGAAATSASRKKAAALSTIFNPQKFDSYHKAQVELEPRPDVVTYNPEEEAEAYYNPVIASETPRLWIVHDEMGISEHEVRESEKVPGLQITDRGAVFNEKGKVVWDQDSMTEAPIYEKRIPY